MERAEPESSRTGFAREAPSVRSLSVAAPAGTGGVSSSEVAAIVRRVVDERISRIDVSPSPAKEPPGRDRAAPTTRTSSVVAHPTPVPTGTIRRSMADGGIANGPSGEGGGPSTTEELDNIDRIAEAVERRILAQLDRRSGRYGGS